MNDSPTTQHVFPGGHPLWLDAPLAEIEGYVDSLRLPAAEASHLRRLLVNWLQFGFVVLHAAIPEKLIDALLRDVAQLIDEYSKHQVLLETDIESARHQPISAYSKRDLQRIIAGPGRFRIIDFYSSSIAAKKISLHPSITGFLKHVFRDLPVVLQSLFFWRGSEQEMHQDFPYVPAHVRSHLVASWVALEDVTSDSGPLLYIPGSHYNERFQWGNGIIKTPDSTKDQRDFEKHLLEQAHDAGVPAFEFLPKKGDVFIWHGALAHGGKPVQSGTSTRKSYVTHYSDAGTHYWDYRDPKMPVIRRRLGDGFYHVLPPLQKFEDVFTHGHDC